MTSIWEMANEFSEIKKSFEFAKSHEGKSLVLYQDYDQLLGDLIQRLSERREATNLLNKVKTFKNMLELERKNYYDGKKGGGNKKRKMKKRRLYF
jgi:hypothetical protein